MTNFINFRKDVCLMALVALGFMSAGCSTPPVPYEDSEDAYEAAMSSYELCSQRTHPLTSNNYCNQVSSSNSLSYNQYTYGGVSNPYFYGSNPYGPSGKAELASTSEENSQEQIMKQKFFAQAWKQYLQSLDAETLKDLAAQWQELANSQ